MSKLRIGFIGLGLIGGSIAKALKAKQNNCEIIAYDTNRESLSLALSEGTIDMACTVVGEPYHTCQYIFLCAPVSLNTAYLHTLAPFLSEDCIVTDVGSVKTSIHLEAKKLGLERQFIGGHPMAGSEKSGYANAKHYLLENCYYVITSSEFTDETRLSDFQQLVSTMGAIPIMLNYDQHDYITAAISHLPHIIAAELVTLIKTTDTKDELMKLLAAGGFKDITRIASSSPTMWQQICLTNSGHITTLLEAYISLLSNIKEKIEAKQKDDIFELFSLSREYRNSIPDSSWGPIKKSFAIYCDIIDEAGGIATIATILASSNISIKNIGIINNREFEEGALRIEFYQEEPSKKAADLLRRHHYTVYER